MERYRWEIGDGGKGKKEEKGNMGEAWEMITRKIIKNNHNDNSNKSTLNIHCYAMLLHTQRASFRTFLPCISALIQALSEPLAVGFPWSALTTNRKSSKGQCKGSRERGRGRGRWVGAHHRVNRSNKSATANRKVSWKLFLLA